MSRLRKQYGGDDPETHRRIQDALNAQPDDRDRLTMPKPTALESFRPWSIAPARKRSAANIAMLREVHAGDKRPSWENQR